jgi:hypothetical protein
VPCFRKQTRKHGTRQAPRTGLPYGVRVAKSRRDEDTALASAPTNRRRRTRAKAASPPPWGSAAALHMAAPSQRLLRASASQAPPAGLRKRVAKHVPAVGRPPCPEVPCFRTLFAEACSLCEVGGQRPAHQRGSSEHASANRRGSIAPAGDGSSAPFTGLRPTEGGYRPGLLALGLSGHYTVFV